MRTSLTEIKEIEEYVFQQKLPDDALVFEAHLLVDVERRKNLRLQLQAYELIRQYGRHLLKKELSILHQQLFTEARHKNFQQHIFSIFKK